MSRRIIPCQVTDEYVRGSGMVVGAAGSHNDVALRLDFGPMWAGTARSIVWKDALGGNPIVTVLGTDLLEPGETEVYIVPIPAEPKAYAGDMTMTIKGAVVDGDKETSATMTARAFFTVMESDWDEDAEETQDITPSQAEQFQAQLEAIKDKIQEATQAAEAAKEAKKSAQAAAASEETTSQNAQSAEQSAQAAKESETSAQAAKESAEIAKNKAEAAVGKVSHIGANGNWYEWDAESGQFVDTGVSAQGPKGDMGDTGPQGPQGERGPAGPAGAGSGDMMANVYDTQGKETDIFAYTDQKIAAIPTPDVSGQINTHNNSTSAHSDIRQAAAAAASTAESNANKYTDQKIAAIPAPDVSGQINAHNTSGTAHSDIRTAVSNAASAAAAAQSTASAAQNAADAKAPMYTYGTADLTAGTSALPTGTLHFVYE